MKTLKRRALSITELNRYVGQTLKNDVLLKHIYLEGEVGSCKIHSSGHIYFTLKDAQAKVNCILFNGDGKNPTLIQEGRHLLCQGSVHFYEKDGSFHLIIREVEDQGQGQLYREFLERKERLEKEGLFDEAHKKKLPFLPKRIGVVTSPTGAVIQDIIQVSKTRFPKVEIILYPAKVQGEGASEEICQGIEHFDKRGNVDVLIVGRGGGSYEELFCFNDEALVRTIFRCHIPVISAVGHETDVSLSDFAADLRAATPSMAAELATPKLMDIIMDLESQKRQLQFLVKQKQKHAEQQLLALGHHLEGLKPKNLWELKKEQLFSLKNRLDQQMKHRMIQKQIQLDYAGASIQLVNLQEYRQDLDRKGQKLEEIWKLTLQKSKDSLEKTGRQLELLSPLQSLSRGYALVYDEKKHPVFSVNQVQAKKQFRILLRDGEFVAMAQKIVPGEAVICKGETGLSQEQGGRKEEEHG